MSFEIGKTLGTNEPFCLDIPSIVTGRTFIASITRFGKSWSARKIVEECFGHAGIIIIDPEGEYISLREKYPFLIIGKDIPLQLETADFMADKILEANISVIIDLSLTEVELGKEYVDKLLRRFFFLETTMRKPYLIIVEEAEEFCPEKGIATTTCLEILRNITKKGGKRGIGIVVIAHRPAWISKGVLSQCVNKAIGRIDWPSDLNVLEEFARIPKVAIEKLPTLDKGEFCFTGDWVKELTFVKVGQVKTTHLGCYTDDVKVLTPDGPKRYDECQEGDLVWSLNLRTGAMEAKRIKRVFVYDYEGPIFRVRGKRVNISVTPNHRMILKTRMTRTWRIEEARQAFERFEFYVPICADWCGYAPTFEELVPSCSEIHSQKFPTSAELGDLLELAGWYIAEGFLAKAKRDCKTKTMTQICSPITDRNRHDLEQLLQKIGFRYSKRPDSVRIYCRRLCAFLEQFGAGTSEKHIPKKFRILPKYLLQRLFDGLMKGDAWVLNKGATRGLPYGYTTVSERLANDIFEIAVKLGLQPRLKKRPPRQREFHHKNQRVINSGPAQEIYFVRTGKGHIRTKRMVSVVPYKGKVWCFEVADNNNMLVTENGTALFSGNSTPEVIPPSPKELKTVIESLQKALPEVIEKIKPTVVSTAEIESKIKSELEAKYKSKIEAILKTADEKAERKYKVRIEQLQEQLDKLSRAQALQPVAPITDPLAHPIVKTRILELPDKARDLLIKIEREPGLTREQLAAFLTTSKDTVASLVDKINRVFHATVIIGDGKPIRYKSMLKRLFITDVAKREIEEIERLQAIAQEEKRKREAAENLLQQTKERYKALEEFYLKHKTDIENLPNLHATIENLKRENEALTEIVKKQESLVGPLLDWFRNIAKDVVKEEVPRVQIPAAAPIDEQKIEAIIEDKIKNKIPPVPGVIPTSVELEHKVTHFDLKKPEEHVKVDTTTLQGRIIYLITKGFFNVRHNRKEIVTELSNHGWIHNDKEVDDALLELCQLGIFKRKISTGNVWWYTLEIDAEKLIRVE